MRSTDHVQMHISSLYRLKTSADPLARMALQCSVIIVGLMMSACPDPLPPDPTLDMSMSMSDSMVIKGGDEVNFNDVGLGGEISGGDQAGEAGGSPVDVEQLCLLCEEGDEPCAEGLTCFTHPESEERFCSLSCSGDDDCPSGYHCGEEAPLDEGDEVGRFCLPDEERCVPTRCRDEDGDGYGRGPDCLGIDCNDDNPEVHAGVTIDLCDLIDNDCDERVDESFIPEQCGVGACMGMTICDGGSERCEGAEAQGEDANCDAVDDDCDGSVDEGYQPLTCGLGACAQPSVCANGQEVCEGGTPPVGDRDLVCDRVDSDCDGVIDEGFVVESSLCGLGVCANRGICTDTGEMCIEGQPLGADNDCDGLDNDCDGSVDEGFVSERVCGFGVCRSDEVCEEGVIACTPSPASGLDNNCNGLDDDCDGIIDNFCADNELSFTLISEGPDHLEIAVIFSRGQEEDLNPATLPQIFELRFTHSDQLSSPTFTNGEAMVEAGFNQPIADRDFANASRIRVILPPGIPPIDYQYTLPGELMRARFTKTAGAVGPFSFGWVPPESFTDANGNGLYDFGESYTDTNNDGQRNNNTHLAPPEANEIILLTNAALGGP